MGHRRQLTDQGPALAPGQRRVGRLPDEHVAEQADRLSPLQPCLVFLTWHLTTSPLTQREHTRVTVTAGIGVASESTGVDRFRGPGRRQQYPAGDRASHQPGRHLTDPRPPRRHRPPRSDDRTDRVSEERAGRPRTSRVNPGIHQHHREEAADPLRPGGEPAQPPPNRLARAPQPLSDHPSPRPCRLRSQSRPDHLGQIRPPDQREHRKEHMRHATAHTPRPPGTHRHRTTRGVTQYPRTCPPPRPQHARTSRTYQLALHQPKHRPAPGQPLP